MLLLAAFWQVTATKSCFVEVQDLNTYSQPDFPLFVSQHLWETVRKASWLTSPSGKERRAVSYQQWVILLRLFSPPKRLQILQWCKLKLKKNVRMMMRMVLSLEHWMNAWILSAIKRELMGRVVPRVTVPNLDPLSPHHSPMPRSKTCRVSAGRTKESHTEAERDAVWIVKKNYAPIIEKHTDPWFSSQAAVL